LTNLVTTATDAKFNDMEVAHTVIRTETLTSMLVEGPTETAVDRPGEVAANPNNYGSGGTDAASVLGSKIGGVVGGAGGVLLLFAVVVFLLVRRWRRKPYKGKAVVGKRGPVERYM
jgi:hypothetical protein